MRARSPWGRGRPGLMDERTFAALVAQAAALDPARVPPCFDSPADYARWQSLDDGRLAPLGVGRYCLDCSREYQSQMVAEGRCLHPNWDPLLQMRRFTMTPTALPVALVWGTAPIAVA